MVRAHHVDHVVTDADMRASGRIIQAGVDGVTPPPGHVLVEQERRKGLTAVED